jgi:hypothetical protein
MPGVDAVLMMDTHSWSVQEKEMKNKHTLDSRLEAIAWGVLLVWWGLRWWPLMSLPNGAGLLGAALILLGLNAARALKGIPAKSATTTIGILALVSGGLLLLFDVWHVSFEIPIFEASLIVLGVILLARELQGLRRQVTET